MESWKWMVDYCHALTRLKSHTLSVHPQREIIILCPNVILVVFGSSQAFTLEDNVLSNFSYDISPKSAIILESILYQLLPVDLIKEWWSNVIPSITIWPGNLENAWLIAHQVSVRSFFGNPEKYWHTKNTLLFLAEYNS